MIENPAEEFAGLQRTFLTDARRAAAGQAAVSDITASGGSGTVTISLNSAGQVHNVRLAADAKRVLGLEHSPCWRDAPRVSRAGGHPVKAVHPCRQELAPGSSATKRT